MSHLKSRRRLPVACLSSLLFFLAIFAYSPTYAAVIRNYAVRYSTNDTGDIAIVGNKLSSCNLAVSNCLNAINGVGSVLNNNSFSMIHIDVDSDPATFNSSSATLSIPTGATVLWAGLYWGGDVNNGVSNTNQAKLQVAGASSYSTISATQLDTTPSQVAGRTRYQGFAPVTAQIQAAGSGSYMVANVQATAGNMDSYAAWALVIVYQDTRQPLRNLTVFDGFGFINSADPAVTIPISGFTTPLSGPVFTKIGTVIYEGDLGLSGDSMRLNSTTLSDGQNPASNFFNSTFSNLGSRVNSKNPNHINQMAFDGDIVNANGILNNGATSATIRFSTTSDAYYPGMISFVTDLHAPQLAGNIVKSVIDLNGGMVEPNDILQYTISVANSGQDAATNTILSDTIPPYSSYVSNSLVITAGANSGAKSDTSGNDQAEYISGLNQVVFRLGTGANGSSGGTIGIGAATTVQFKVRVNDPLANATVITNQATIDYRAATTGQIFTSPSNPASVAVVSAPQLSVSKRDAVINDLGPLGPSPGDTLRYTIQVNNSGNADATGAVFSDTPGANTTLVNGSVTTSQGTVTNGNSGEPNVSISLGTLAGLGGSATITFDVVIASPVPAGITQVANQGFLTSNELPIVPTDDPDTAPAADSTITAITAIPAIAVYKSDNLVIDADGDGNPSPGDTLEYTIVVINSGNQDATGVALSDTPDGNAPLIVGTVTTSQGTVTSGNVAGDQWIGLTIGTLTGGNAVTVQFRVTIVDPLPVGVSIIRNQAIVSSDQLPPVQSDDPDTAIIADPTFTPVTAFPLLHANKSAILIIDADGNGMPSPGDTLRYQIVTSNSGNAAATGVTFRDLPDANSTLVVGSVQTTLGVVLRGNTANDTDVSVDLISLLGGARATISFDVLINSGLTTVVTQVANQGSLSSNELPPLPTDDPTTALANDPTVTPITAAPVLVPTKQDMLFIDADNDGRPSPGDTLLYQVVIANIGNAMLQNVVFTDALDVNTALVGGSVQTTAGSVTVGNGVGDTAVAVALGTIPAGSQVTISFQAMISNPLAVGVIQIINQGWVSSTELPTMATDDPDTLAASDPTVTVVTARPRLSVTKSVSLLVDADGDGLPSAGDSLAYQINIDNSGNMAATGVILDDLIDNNTFLVLFTVQSSLGTVVGGNNPGDNNVRVELDTVPANVSVQLSFQVVIKNPLPVGLTQITNQAAVSSNELPTLLSDDPSTPQLGDPTIVLVTSEPNLVAHKSETLWTDADGDSRPSPGDTLLYSVNIANTGHSTATLVTFTDTPDIRSTLVIGSVQTSQGSVVTGNGSFNTSVEVAVGSIPAGASVTLTFRVTINLVFPSRLNTISNQGLVSSNELPNVPTDDPSTQIMGDPTVTSIVAVPLITVTKRGSLAVDADGDGLPSPGDTLLYNVTIRNYGHISATLVSFSDTPGTYTSLITGTVATNRGIVTSGNDAGDTSLIVNIGTLPVDRNVQISFEVRIMSPLPAGVTTVSNQGTVVSNELGAQLSDDPDSGAAVDATVIIVNAAPDLQLHKTDGGATVTMGGNISFVLSYSNIGTQDATGVVLTETVPAHTTFRKELSDPNWSCSAISPGSVCTLVVGNLNAGSSGSVTLVVTADPTIPAEVKSVRNVADISDDGSNGSDLNYADNSASDDTLISVPPTAITFKAAAENKARPGAHWFLVPFALSLATFSVLRLRKGVRKSEE